MKKCDFEIKVYEALGVKGFRKFVVWLKGKVNKITKTNSNDNYFLKGYKADDVEFLKKQFIKNFAIHLFGVAIGVMVMAVTATDSEFNTVRFLLGLFVAVINIYPVMLQRYNIIRIDGILKRKKQKI